MKRQAFVLLLFLGLSVDFILTNGSFTFNAGSVIVSNVFEVIVEAFLFSILEVVVFK